MNTLILEEVGYVVKYPSRFLVKETYPDVDDDLIIKEALDEMESELEIHVEIPPDIYSIHPSLTKRKKKSYRGILKGIDIKDFEEYLKNSREEWDI